MRTILLAAAFTAAALIPAAASGNSAKSVTGKASWYQCCARTANGERYNPDGLTAAHRTLPFGTKLLVEHVGSGKKVLVTVNDRGPFIKGRVIDLSRGAAKKLGMIGSGVATIRFSVVR